MELLSEESTERSDLEVRAVFSEMNDAICECDVVLETEDGGQFTVHRSVMSLCSFYFKALFSTELNVQKQNRFLIRGINITAMSEIVKYAYSGYTAATEETVEDLLIGADMLNVLGMLKDCCDFLLFRLDFQNCIGIRKFAWHYSCEELKEAADRFLLRHFVEVTEQSSEYLEMPLEEVVKLLNSERINVRSEEQVWEAGVRWIDFCPEDRKGNIDAILKSVRLGLLDPVYFQERVKQHHYVRNNELCRPIIIETLKFLWDLENITESLDEVATPQLAIPRIPYSIMFSIGGWSDGAPTDLVETYDTKADRWIEVDARDPAGARAYHKLAVLGTDIYVIGGFDGTKHFSSCRCFNAITKQWRSVAPMHSKRCYVSVAILNDLIYAIGGYDGHHRQNTVERYDYHTNQWTLITPMNQQRSDASASTLNGLIYVVGGFNGIECLASCEFYNPATDNWTSLSNMRQRRSGVSMIAHRGHLYALGGFNGITRLQDGERYDPETDQWSVVPNMHNPRSNFAIEVIDDLIFVLGGFNGVGTIFHVECYDASAKEWLDATDMNAARSALAACVVPGLPNVQYYVHQNRAGLMEEKRQKMLRQKLEREIALSGRHF